jgi:hypothetical protein
MRLDMRLDRRLEIGEIGDWMRLEIGDWRIFASKIGYALRLTGKSQRESRIAAFGRRRASPDR